MHESNTKISDRYPRKCYSNYLNEKGFSVCGYSSSYVVITVPVLCYFHEIDTKISNSILKYDT